MLFICTANELRSLTAEKIYAHDERFTVQSKGTDTFPEKRVAKEHLEWADYIFVMEPGHKLKLQTRFPELARQKPIFCLHIPDEYNLMDPALIELIRERFEAIFKNIQT